MARNGAKKETIALQPVGPTKWKETIKKRRKKTFIRVWYFMCLRVTMVLYASAGRWMISSSHRITETDIKWKEKMDEEGKGERRLWRKNDKKFKCRIGIKEYNEADWRLAMNDESL